MSDMHESSIAMSSADYSAIEFARDHVTRALSAARAAEPFDSQAMVALDSVRTQLAQSLRTLEAIKAHARVTP